MQRGVQSRRAAAGPAGSGSSIAVPHASTLTHACVPAPWGPPRLGRGAAGMAVGSHLSGSGEQVGAVVPPAALIRALMAV